MASSASQSPLRYLNTEVSASTESGSSASLSPSDNSSGVVAIGRHQQRDMDGGARQQREDISAAMAEVLGIMDRIVVHLRRSGETNAANLIARDVISMVTVFNETTAPWDIEAGMMRTEAPIPVSNAPTSTLTPSVTSSAPLSGTSTWAAVAAITPAGNNGLVGSTPSRGIATRYGEPQKPEEALDADSRVIWIHGWNASRHLSEVTESVGQGPIYSMVYSSRDTSVCVIFLYASSAKALLDDNATYARSNGHSRFGPACTVSAGQPFPANIDVMRMQAPANERRRLTFARQQLFTNGVTETSFKADIFAIVGEANVELVWLFNTGNATVVFSAVPIARLVREEFRRRSHIPGSPYRGVVVSFSHDPCERPMSLVTQMPAGHAQRSLGQYGGTSALPANIVHEHGNAVRRTVLGRQTSGRACDDGNPSGWQIVTARRR